MVTDSMICWKFPRFARWKVVVVDPLDGEEHQMEIVRFRWLRNAEKWKRWATDRYIERGMTVGFAVRPVR